MNVDDQRRNEEEGCNEQTEATPAYRVLRRNWIASYVSIFLNR